MTFFRRLRTRLLRLRSDDSGVVMLETVLVFPIQLMVMMIIIQIAHLYVAANVLHYAAFQGVRTATLNVRGGEHDEAIERGKRAAWVVASVINNEGGGSRRIRVPANTYVYPSYAAEGERRMQMDIVVPDTEDMEAVCSLYYWLDLVVPVGGPAVYQIMKEAGRPVAVNNTNSRGMLLMNQKARYYKAWPR